MFTSAELVEAIQRVLRRGRSIRPPRPAGEFPPGWHEWFAMARERVRHAGFDGEGLAATFLAREPVHPRGYRRLNGWQAFTRLWWHDWRERPAADRGRRSLSLGLSILLHLAWLQLMILLMVAHYPGADAEDARLGENVTQVEFIGQGTPEDAGGGAAQDEQPVPEVAASPAPAAAAPVAPAPAPSPPQPEPSVAEVETPVQEVPPPVAAQPLEVTQTPEPDTSFVLVEPRLADLPVALPTPELQAPTPEVRLVEVPMVTPPQVRPLPRSDVSVPELRQPEIDLVEREVPMPTPAPEIALQLPRSAPPAPELRSEGPEIAIREVQLRTPGSAAAAAAAERPGDGSAQGQPASGGQAQAGAEVAGGVRAEGQGTAPSAGAAGAGLVPGAPPGALPSPRRGDDFGDSTRSVPGGQAGSPSGLFNADGSPRLAGNDGRVGGGLPPGTVTEDYEKIDRRGTWLKRPPIGYEPTAFDRFWVPHENLLEEWVRRSIKEVLIPIPGTGKRIKCTVAMLMLGGACGITDPNMLDVEADARKPPDVPFKRELQENQESLGAPSVP